MSLKLFNTLSKSKEIFQPIDKDAIKVYACGPTLYNNPHIGNFRPIIIFDILFRILKQIYGDGRVTYVRNITDIDDKIINKANDLGLSTSDLVSKTEIVYQKNLEALNILRPSFEPKATDYIPKMIEMIETLITKGYAYESSNHVLFETRKFQDYGTLSKFSFKDIISGARVEIADYKKNPEDFVLWKPSNDNEPFWSSPWGKGRPGWHLECSAMSKKFLGNEFDIHGGGIDLLFPHHENEIAQSRCANDTKILAKYWIHNAFITMSNEKMAKSQGNILKIKDFKEKLSGQVLRLALMSAHYKQPLDWNDKLLNDCKNTIEKWYDVYLSLEKSNAINKEVCIETYKDHRMAMAFAPLALKTSFSIKEAEVVSKSFPDFWDNLAELGFNISESEK